MTGQCTWSYLSPISASTAFVFLISSIHHQAVSIYSSQDTRPCAFPYTLVLIQPCWISCLPCLLSELLNSNNNLLIKLSALFSFFLPQDSFLVSHIQELLKLKICFPKIQGSDSTLRLAHIPQVCEFHLNLSIPGGYRSCSL